MKLNQGYLLVTTFFTNSLNIQLHKLLNNTPIPDLFTGSSYQGITQM